MNLVPINFITINLSILDKHQSLFYPTKHPPQRPENTGKYVVELDLFLILFFDFTNQQIYFLKMNVLKITEKHGK